MKTIKNIFLGSMLVLLCSQCESTLEPEIFSETTPAQLFNSVDGVESILYGGYANVATMNVNDGAQSIIAPETMTDVMYAEGGAINNWATNFTDFVLDGIGSRMYGVYWNLPYQGIRNANIILENIEGAEIPEASKSMIAAEAHFIRGWGYYLLYQRFGPTPLRTNTTQPLELARATEEEMKAFIENEFLTALPDLPDPGEELLYGRAHKGAAMAFLTKLYLNTEQWQKCADMAQNVMNLSYYELYPDYFELFQDTNERNREFIWVRTSKSDLDRTASISYMNFAYPANFASDPNTGLTFCEGCRNFGTHLKMRDEFFLSFDENDRRRSLIITEYINTNGDLVNLLPPDENPRPFKYWPGEDISGPSYGNDVPVIRYADILLSRAEALNRLNGPNQESIDLINEVRERAELDDIALADFENGETLNQAILDERGWEFYLEDIRREDLIRHGEFISRAQQRGNPAQPHHVRYPIPQFAMDANPLLEQNDGY
ncbi:MAG: RagB/SusD family nutrient uptake outer membrane protein [Flavobacteriaceae bacterium]|nr:RagB/SusD family nutrient uptake outer membrane protein [Flavobacteriaceae bacterium]